MSLQKLILALAGFSTMITATNMNLGCGNCLDNSQDDIRYGCYEMCSSALNPASSEYKYCRLTCSGFVFDDNCCTNTGACSSDPNQCMNTFFPPSSSSKRDVDLSLLPYAFNDRNHARDFSPEPEPEPESNAIAIRVEMLDVNYGKACCKAVQAVLSASTLKVMPLIAGQRWDEDTAAGLILVAFGLAGAMGCNAAFGVSCVFNAGAGVAGPLAAGALPVPMAPPPPGVPAG